MKTKESDINLYTLHPQNNAAKPLKRYKSWPEEDSCWMEKYIRTHNEIPEGNDVPLLVSTKFNGKYSEDKIRNKFWNTKIKVQMETSKQTE